MARSYTLEPAAPSVPSTLVPYSPSDLLATFTPEPLKFYEGKPPRSSAHGCGRDLPRRPHHGEHAGTPDRPCPRVPEIGPRIQKIIQGVVEQKFRKSREGNRTIYWPEGADNTGFGPSAVQVRIPGRWPTSHSPSWLHVRAHYSGRDREVDDQKGLYGAGFRAWADTAADPHASHGRHPTGLQCHTRLPLDDNAAITPATDVHQAAAQERATMVVRRLQAPRWSMALAALAPVRTLCVQLRLSRFAQFIRICRWLAVDL